LPVQDSGRHSRSFQPKAQVPWAHNRYNSGVDLQAFEALLGPEGQAALAEAEALKPSADELLANLTRLQKRYDRRLAAAALETAMLRQRAQAKFSRASSMYFTRDALEQASGEVVSTYRAARFAGAGPVADLGCGIGGDSLGLAAVGRVLAVDRDELRLRMARQNLAADGLAGRADFVLADLTRQPWRGVPAFFFDPARRSGGKRRYSVRDYEPPLAAVRAWLGGPFGARAAGVKISPGVSLAELSGYDCEVEFISHEGELKECVLWFGGFKTAERRATLLPGPHSLLADPAARAEAGPPQDWLYEPDPAVLRAGLVTTLAAGLGARQLDPDIAYLTARDLRPTPFARAYRLQEALPFQLKRLRQRLRELNVGQVTVKKRGSPIALEDLIRQLRLSGAESRIVFLTHVQGKPFALIAVASPTP
jgi:SAM-dependent methyltransferase